MATREENLKKINDELEKLSDEELEKIAGGSWMVYEKPAKAAGIYLLKDDDTPGEWGWLYNTGNYYWRGQKINHFMANRIIEFNKKYGHQPNSVEEAYEDYENSGNGETCALTPLS